MKRLVAMILVLLLLVPVLPVFAETTGTTTPTSAIETAVNEFLQSELPKQAEQAKGEWQRYIYKQGFASVTMDLENFDIAAGKPISVSFLMANGQPDYSSIPDYEGDPTPWLEAAVKSMGEPKASIKLKLNITAEGDKCVASFAKGAEAALKKDVDALAAKAPKAVADKLMQAALVDYLMPTPIVMPKKEPEDASLEEVNPAFTAYMERNNLNDSEAGAFAKALLYSIKVKKLDASRGPEKVILSYSVPDAGVKMAEALEDLVLNVLPYDAKVKSYPRKDLLAQFAAHSEKKLLTYRYEGKAMGTDAYTVNLLSLPNPITPDDLFKRELYPPSETALYLVDTLVEVVKEMPDYPVVPLPSNGVIIGEDKGTKVIFTFYKTPYDHHVVSAYDHWTHELVAASFSANRKSVQMRLPNGDYDFKVTGGSVWYGPEYLFGPFSVDTFLDGDFLALRGQPYKVTINMSN